MKKRLVFLMLIMFSLQLYSQDFTYNGVNYTVIDKNAKTCRTKAGSSSSNPGNNISGPLKLTDIVYYGGVAYTLTEIGQYSFYKNEVSGSLEIPNSVQTIGERAFYGCKGFDGTLTLPNTLKEIPRSAFDGCSGFTGSLEIPNSVQTIEYGAFYGCSGFTGSLEIPTSVQTIGTSAFYGCKGFDGTLTLPNTLKEIPNYAFYSCSGFTGSLEIPNSVQTIGADAFKNCSGFTGSLTIPNSVKTISSDAFYNCTGFTGSLEIPNSVQTIGISAFYGCKGFTGSLTISNSVKTISTDAFYNCTGFTGSLTIGNSVETIGVDAFYGCTGFTGSLTIPNSVKTIYSYAFSGCSGFTGSLTIPNSVETIGVDAFYGCTGFTGSLTIPNSVETIGAGAFYNCTGFTGSLTIGNSVEKIGEIAFYYCNFKYIKCKIDKPLSINSNVFSNYEKVLYVPSESLEAYSKTYPWNKFKLILPSNFKDDDYFEFESDGFIYKEINDKEAKVFRYLGQIDNLKIPETATLDGTKYSVVGIGEYAFFYSKNLNTINIPNSIKSIETEAFVGCENIKQVNISGLKAWCDITFSGNAYANPLYSSNADLYLNGEKVVTLEIPDNITSLKYATFAGCGSIETVKLPSTLDSIAGLTFTKCPSLKTVYCYAEFPPELTADLESDYNEGYAFAGCDLVRATLHVPKDRLYNYLASPGWKNFGKIIDDLESNGYDGIESVFDNTKGEHVDIFSLQGVCLKRNATKEDIESLNPGLYIIGGKKVLIK